MNLTIRLQEGGITGLCADSGVYAVPNSFPKIKYDG